MIPVPWDVTTSYGGGASEGPQHILEASPQLDLFDLTYQTPYKKGIHLLPIDDSIKAKNTLLRPIAQDLQRKREEGISFSEEDKRQEDRINQGCIETHDWVYNCSKDILADHKIPAVVGGDHSTPFGLIKALFEQHPDAGLLHIDAHADLRVAYQDFVHSHASIMHNVMALEHAPTSLVQVGIRDFCEEEYRRITSDSRIHTFFGPQLQDALFEGSTWAHLCHQICSKLPQKVYVSFDIDGLSPLFCPSTGTPVPGGLSFSQARYLLKTLAQSNRNIIGFDLNEVAPSSQGEWDGNVGARILYQLCGAALFAS